MPRRVRRLLVVTSAGRDGRCGRAHRRLGRPRRALRALDLGRRRSRSTSTAPATRDAGRRRRRPPAPTKTSGRGFTRVGNLITLSTDLTFEVNSARLNGRAQQVLDDVITQVRVEKRTGTIVVNGFTDSDGTERHNMQLSQSRADAVAALPRERPARPRDPADVAGPRRERPQGRQRDRGRQGRQPAGRDHRAGTAGNPVPGVLTAARPVARRTASLLDDDRAGPLVVQRLLPVVPQRPEQVEQPVEAARPQARS